jgi:hypothetical protein
MHGFVLDVLSQADFGEIRFFRENAAGYRKVCWECPGDRELR